MMDVQGFHHVALQVHDLERTAAFYRDLLGFPELQRHLHADGSLRSIWVGVPGGGFLAIEAASHPPPRELLEEPFRHGRPGLLLLAFRIPRAAREGALAAFERAGVRLEHQTRWSLYVRDPEGNRIALSHHPED
jgi:glyoxylase I family protein